MSTRAGDRERQHHILAHGGTTPYLYFVIFWTVLSTFNFGFGTSELNPLQNVLSCPKDDASLLAPTDSWTSPPSCISLTSSQFGYITAMFTVGGFLSSLTLSPLRNISFLSILKRSKNALLMAALWNILGGFVQMLASTWKVLALGRFLMGLGSGVAVAVVPSYLK
jgi:MFS family permease